MSEFCEDDFFILEKIQKIDREIADIFDFDTEFSQEINKHNKEVDKINNEIKSLQEKIQEVKDSIEKEKENIEIFTANLKEYEKKKEEMLNGAALPESNEQIDEQIDIQRYSIELSNKKILQNECVAYEKKMQLEYLEQTKTNIETSFVKFKDLVVKNNQGNTEKIDELKKQKEILIAKLSFPIAKIYNNIVSDDTIHYPIGGLKNGVCVNCNLLNIKKFQLDIISRKKLVRCENCGSILIYTINDEDNEDAQIMNTDVHNLDGCI